MLIQRLGSQLQELTQRLLLHRHKIKFVCHSDSEYCLAEKINSVVPRFILQDGAGIFSSYCW